MACSSDVFPRYTDDVIIDAPSMNVFTCGKGHFLYSSLLQDVWCSTTLKLQNENDMYTRHSVKSKN